MRASVISVGLFCNERMMHSETTTIRCLVVITLSLLVAVVAGNEQAYGQRKIEFQGQEWAVGNVAQVSVREYLGKTALQVRGNHDTFVYLPNVDARDATIEVDIAADSRCEPGVCFRSRADGEGMNKIILRRWAKGCLADGNVLEQAVITRRQGTVVYLMIDIPQQRDSVVPPATAGWFHLKVVCRGGKIIVYLDDDETPIFEVAGMRYSEATGTLGMCGGDFHFANFRYTVHGE